MDTLIEAVKTHAIANYEVKSWSYIVEAFDDEEIEEEIGDATTVGEAIENVGKWVDLHHSYAEDIRNS